MVADSTIERAPEGQVLAAGRTHRQRLRRPAPGVQLSTDGGLQRSGGVEPCSRAGSVYEPSREAYRRLSNVCCRWLSRRAGAMTRTAGFRQEATFEPVPAT